MDFYDTYSATNLNFALKCLLKKNNMQLFVLIHVHAHIFTTFKVYVMNREQFLFIQHTQLHNPW